MEHKYFIEYNGVQEEVFPTNPSVKIKGERKDYKVREKISSDIVLTTNRGYEFIKALEEDNPSLTLIVKRKESGVWIERIRSLFYPKDCDYDTCQVIIHCAELDLYNKILLHLEDKYNILSIAPLEQYVYTDICQTGFKYRTEIFEHTFQVGELLTDSGLPSYGIFHPEYPHPFPARSHYKLYESQPDNTNQTWQIQKIYAKFLNNTTWTSIPPFHVNNSQVTCYFNVTWYTCFTITFDLNGISNPPPDINGIAWKETEVRQISEHVYRIWEMRPHQVYDGTSTPHIHYSGNLYHEEIGFRAFPIAINGISSSSITTNINFNYIWRSLKDILNNFVGYIDNALTVESNLLFSDTNPITGNENLYYKSWTGEISREIYVAAKSDIKNYTATEQSTIQLYTLKKLLDNIFIMYNGGWYISGNVLRIEHIESLNNNNIYPINTNNTEIIDISSEVGVKNHNKYTYDKSLYYHMYVMEMNEVQGLDYKGVDIVMNASFASDKQIVKTDILDALSCDIANIVTSSSLSNIQFLL